MGLDLRDAALTHDWNDTRIRTGPDSRGIRDIKCVRCGLLYAAMVARGNRACEDIVVTGVMES